MQAAVVEASSIAHQLPGDVLRGVNPAIQHMKHPGDWVETWRLVQLQDEATMLMTGEDDAKPPKLNLLHAMAQFQGPEPSRGEVTAEDTAYLQVTAEIMRVYGGANALNWLGGKWSDTPLMKACGNGNKFVALALINAGAGLLPPRPIIPPLGRFFFFSPTWDG